MSTLEAHLGMFAQSAPRFLTSPPSTSFPLLIRTLLLWIKHSNAESVLTASAQSLHSLAAHAEVARLLTSPDTQSHIVLGNALKKRPGDNATGAICGALWALARTEKPVPLSQLNTTARASQRAILASTDGLLTDVYEIIMTRKSETVLRRAVGLVTDLSLDWGNHVREEAGVSRLKVAGEDDRRGRP